MAPATSAPATRRRRSRSSTAMAATYGTHASARFHSRKRWVGRCPRTAGPTMSTATASALAATAAGSDRCCAQRTDLRIDVVMVPERTDRVGGTFSAAPTTDPRRSAPMDVAELVATYGESWNEPDEAARRKLLDAAWSDDGTYCDPTAS